MGVVSRIKTVLRKVLRRVPGVRRLMDLKNMVLDKLDRLGARQDRMLSMQMSTLQALVSLLERRQDIMSVDTVTQVLQQITLIREQMTELKQQAGREALTRRSA